MDDETEVEVTVVCPSTVGHFGDIQCALVAGHKYAHVAKAGDTTYTWGDGQGAFRPPAGKGQMDFWVIGLAAAGGYAVGTALGLVIFPLLFDWWDRRHGPL